MRRVFRQRSQAHVVPVRSSELRPSSVRSRGGVHGVQPHHHVSPSPLTVTDR